MCLVWQVFGVRVSLFGIPTFGLSSLAFISRFRNLPLDRRPLLYSIAFFLFVELFKIANVNVFCPSNKAELLATDG